jgi:subtilisin-like proprotein convertase family protein
MRWLLLLAFAFFAALPAFGQPAVRSPYWEDTKTEEAKAGARLKAYRGIDFDINALRQVLAEARHGAAVELSLPLPGSGSAVFSVVESPVMEAALAAKYPDIKTYRGISRTPGISSVRFDLGPKGLHASIHTTQGAVYIDPASETFSHAHVAYWVKDHAPPAKSMGLSCGAPESGLPAPPPAQASSALDFREAEGGSETLTLFTYRLAMAATRQYANFHGGTKEKALAAMVTKVNRINHVFERDLAVRLVLVGNNDAIIFTSAADDPYTNGDEEKMLYENMTVLAQRIGNNNYDIGHVLGTKNTFGGVASLGSVCGEYKAMGASTRDRPNGDPFVIGILAHELGHQLGATHTFNNCHNANPNTAYEPGGGTTIMSYAGICTDPRDNFQSIQSDYFHTISIEQILTHTRIRGGRHCAERTPTSNRAPEVFVDIPSGLYIPIKTPFKLEARAVDPDDDPLTYCWEQVDVGDNRTPPGSAQGNDPLFRSFPPSESPARIFPRMELLLSNGADLGEMLPDYSRDLNFRCTVRDNHPEGGAVAWGQLTLRSDVEAGPFRVVFPQGADVEWKAGAYTQVRWDVANTNNARVNCQYVDIWLSLDGGATFTHLLAEGAPNTGLAYVTVPNAASNRARIRIDAVDNVFFALSQSDFTIWPATAPTYTLQVSPSMVRRHCLPAPLEFEIQSSAIMNFNHNIELALMGNLPPSANYEFSKKTIRPRDNESSRLTIWLNTFVEDTFHLRIRVVAPNMDTSYRDISFITVSNDWSALAPVSPVDGTEGIKLSAVFQWEDVPDADSYDFQLAVSPSFEGMLFDQAQGLSSAEYTSRKLLPDNELFFWRVRPVNECGPGPYLRPQAFHTATTSCRRYQSDDTPVRISGSGLPTVESKIRVNESGTVNKVIIPYMRVAYQTINVLRISLVSPSGKEVVLYNRGCGNTNLLLAGFDDDAPNALRCPPTDSLVYKALEPLAGFAGESMRGDWTLRVRVVASGFGSAGSIQRWSLEFCSDVTPERPVLLRADTLLVPPGRANTITTKELLVAGDPSTHEFILVTMPAHGMLFLNNNQQLRAGNSFTQSHINGMQLLYYHQSPAEERDSFTFVLRNTATGGWLPTQTFSIRADRNAIVSVDRPAAAGLAFQVYPNPASNFIHLRFDRKYRGAPSRIAVHLYNALGQSVWHHWIDDETAAGTGLDIPVEGLSEGMYFLQARSGVHSLTRKVAIKR